MNITATTEYACLAMIKLADHYPDPSPVSLVDITRTEDIPQQYLVHILRQMKSAGLVQSHRGAFGGYSLKRDPNDITLNDIITVIGPHSVKCRQRLKKTTFANRLEHVWRDLELSELAILRKTTLASLVAKKHDN